MHSGTRFPCWCSVMKRWISSEVEDRTTDQRQRSHDPQAAKALVLTFALPHRQQAVLVAVAERPLRHWLKVPRVHPPAGDRVAALAHAGVVAQTPFVQVGVGQRVAAGDPLGLDSKTRCHYARKTSPKTQPATPTHRIEDQHAAEQMHRLVRGAIRQHVEHRQRRLKKMNNQHSSSSHDKETTRLDFKNRLNCSNQQRSTAKSLNSSYLAATTA